MRLPCPADRYLHRCPLSFCMSFFFSRHAYFVVFAVPFVKSLFRMEARERDCLNMLLKFGVALFKAHSAVFFLCADSMMTPTQPVFRRCRAYTDVRADAPKHGPARRGEFSRVSAGALCLSGATLCNGDRERMCIASGGQELAASFTHRGRVPALRTLNPPLFVTVTVCNATRK